MINRSIWVTWEKQQRNLSLVEHFGAKYLEIEDIKPRVLKYIVNMYKTTRAFRREAPEVIFAQNPSVVLAAYVVLYAKLFNKISILDVHNSGIFPFEGSSAIVNYLAGVINRNANMIFVSNDELKDYTSLQSCNARTLPDPLPKLNAGDSDYVVKHYSILFVCTWSSDEPYEELLSIKNFPEDTTLYITGNYKKKLKPEKLDDINPNIVLTGFLKAEEYVHLLSEVDAVMVLTTRENCLVCGAYEAVSVHKPLILSDTKALRKYFSKGVVYSMNNASALLQAIKEVKQNHASYKSAVIELESVLQKDWKALFAGLVSEIKDMQDQRFHRH